MRPHQSSHSSIHLVSSVSLASLSSLKKYTSPRIVNPAGTDYSLFRFRFVRVPSTPGRRPFSGTSNESRVVSRLRDGSARMPAAAHTWFASTEKYQPESAAQKPYEHSMEIPKVRFIRNVQHRILHRVTRQGPAKKSVSDSLLRLSIQIQRSARLLTDRAGTASLQKTKCPQIRPQRQLFGGFRPALLHYLGHTPSARSTRMALPTSGCTAPGASL